jgi:hypothetical protein
VLQYSTESGPRRPVQRRKRARAAGFANRTLLIWITGKGLQRYSHVSLTVTKIPPDFCFCTTPGPPRRAAPDQTTANLYWPNYTTASPPFWWTSNSTLRDYFPSLNCCIRALHHPSHGDSARNGPTEMFPMIQWILAQLDGSESIKSTQWYWNKESEDMNGPETRWPRRGHTARCSWLFWRKSQIGTCSWAIGGTTWWVGCLTTLRTRRHAQFIGSGGDGSWIGVGAVGAGEGRGHWWRNRGVHRRSGSERVSSSVPRLLPRSKEPWRGITKVAGVSTMTPAVWPHHNGYRHGDKLPLRPYLPPREIFHLPVNIHSVPGTNPGDRRKSERVDHRRRGGLNPGIFQWHCTMEDLIQSA